MIRDKQVRGSGFLPRLRTAVRRSSRVALVAFAGAGLSGCTDWALYDLDYLWGSVPFLSTLRGTVAYHPNTLPRLPAEGTIPVYSPIGDVPPPFTQAQLDSAAVTLTNPFAPTAPPVVLARGQEVYDRQCSVCHGPAGAGNGSVVGPGKFPLGPAINGSTVAARSDEYVYAIIAVGRGLMPAYGERITHLDRWAVAAYVQQLQQMAGATAPAAPAVASPAQPAAPPAAVPADTAAANDR